VDLNLDTLKREILEYLDTAGFAVFHGTPGGLEGMPMILWDASRHPDYQMFLDVARKCGAKLVVFASAEFDADEVDELLGQLEDCEMSRDERRDYESRLRPARAFGGVTCSLELAFDYHNRLYVYEVRPDWYDEFLEVEDEMMALRAGEDDLNQNDSLGGYFSNN
jgi:hypothetical protein